MTPLDTLTPYNAAIQPALGGDLPVRSPIDGSLLATLKTHGASDVATAAERAQAAFLAWREVPAPRRGELVRRFGEVLRTHKEDLARLVTAECGKILEEGRGEVQEMIDVCDFAVGLSRQLYGLTIASERPLHVMHENWHPLGPVGIISAFNFPVAVWSWNTALAWVCGDSTVWKPSEKTPLTALACQWLFEQVAREFGAPEHLSQVVIGDREVGEALVDDVRFPLISATGSTRMGRAVGPRVAARFGRCLLELGGNNAMIISDKADLGVAMPSLLFGAVGTAGQRCTTTRRAIVHRSLFDRLYDDIARAMATLAKERVGDPLADGTLIGPLIDQASFEAMQDALARARADAMAISGGERLLAERYPDAFYVAPAVVKMAAQTDVVRTETFAPILYVMPYYTLDEAMAMHNDVPQGLSSTIVTNDLREAEIFKRYSDCGIANVNIGTSGAEIGGAFGGEKETGGGRESGSDSWKQYMRRQTSTTYFGTKPPALAQGIRFDLS